MMTLRKEDDITQDIKILRTSSLSQDTILYKEKRCQKIWKNCTFCLKIAKIRDVKRFKTIPLPLETMQ